MNLQIYEAEKVATAKKYMSGDAIFILVSNALLMRKPLSLVRMGDGERSIILGVNKRYLTDKVWLKEYGLVGADFKKVQTSVIKAANEADIFCPNISGLMLDRYEIIPHVNARAFYGSGIICHEWLYMGRVPKLLQHTGGVGVVCRDSQKVANGLCDKYSIVRMEYADYDSWEDYGAALKFIGGMKANLILCSVGASGKYLIVEAARKFNKVVIDAGSAMIRHWSTKKSREI